MGKLITPVVGRQYKIKCDGWTHKRESITTVTRVEDVKGGAGYPATSETRIWMSLPDSSDKFVTPDNFNSNNIEEVIVVTPEEIEEARQGLAQILGIE